MVSVVILYAGERDKLLSCLRSVQFASDILIISDSSRTAPPGDLTAPPIRIIERPLDGDFSQSRRVGMEQAAHDWILFVDADEIVGEELAEYLTHFSPENGLSCYRIPRIDTFWGRQVTHGEVADASSAGIIRLVNRKEGVFVGKVHERFMPRYSVGRVPHRIFHTPHETITSFLHTINFYSSLRAREIQSVDRPLLFFQLLLYPPVKFVYTYFLRAGFVDGAAGFVYSFMMAFHSYLVRAKALTKTYDTV